MKKLPTSSEAATPPAAIGYALSAYLVFTMLDTSAKYVVVSGVDPLFTAWVRFAIHVLVALVLLRGWRSRARFRAVSPVAQTLRGVTLFGSTIFNFLALQTLQLAETTSILFFAPMLVTAIAGPLLGEWAGWRRWMAILAGFFGVLIITRPGFGELSIGHVYAMCGVVCYSLYVISTRLLAATETSESMILYSALAPVILLAPTLPFTATVPHDAWHWIILLSVGFYGAVGHWFLILAYRNATASALGPYAYLQMVWTIGAGWLVFRQFPDLWTIVGASIIMASGLYIVHREHRLHLKKTAVPNAEDEELAKKL